MSHIAHINTYKKELINAGVTNPETQIAFVRTAYVTALIRLFNKKAIDSSTRALFMNKVLSYWNEMLPVNGAAITISVNTFFSTLCKEVENFRGVIYIRVIDDKLYETFPDFAELPGYEDLVNVLYKEAEDLYLTIPKE